MSLVSAKQIKIDTGISVPTVRAACALAGVPVHSGNLYDRDAAIAAVRANAEPGRLTGHAAAGLGNVQGPEIATYASARTLVAGLQARKLQLEIETSEGRLVDRASVVAAGVDLITRVRGALLSVGTRSATSVAGKTDALEIATIINGTVFEVLAELADHDVFNDAVLQ